MDNSIYQKTDEFLRSLQVSASELLALERLSQRAEDIVVFISGSLLEGLGNHTSDIDLYVIGNARPFGQAVNKKSFIHISKHAVGARRVDVEFWKGEAVAVLAERLSNVAVGRDLDTFQCEEIDFIHRMKVGLPLTGGPALRDWQQKFDYGKLQAYMRHRSMINVKDTLEDLDGMLAADDLEVALVRSHDLLCDLCDYGVRCAGETNPKRKWAIRLLGKYPDMAVATRVRAGVRSLMFPTSAQIDNSAGARSHVRACIEFAHQVLEM